MKVFKFYPVLALFTVCLFGCAPKKPGDLIVGEWLLHPISSMQISQQDSLKRKMVFLKNDSAYLQTVINGKVENSEAATYTLANDGKNLLIKHTGQTTDSLQVIDISNDTLKLRLTLEPGETGTVILTMWKE